MGSDSHILTINSGSSSLKFSLYVLGEFLGIHLDSELNQENAQIISKQDSQVTVRVMKTNEELMLARHTQDLLTG